MAIVPYRGNQRQVALQGPSAFALTHKQQLAVARVAGQAGKAALRAAFGKQNAGGDSHDSVVARRQRTAGIPRAPRMRANTAALRNAPGAGRGQGWDVGDFAAMSHGDMMRKMWDTNPATSNAMAPRGHGYYDAFANHPTSAMTNMSIGPATPICAKTRIPQSGQDQGIDTGGKVPQLLIIGPAATSTQAQLYYKSTGAGGDFIASTPFQASALPEQPYPSTPEEYPYRGELHEVIPVRCSVRVRNYSAEINRGGIVHVLRMTTGIALGAGVYTTNDEFDDLCDAIRDHARTRTYDGADFGGVGLQKNCVVADQSRSLMFQNFNQCKKSTDIGWAPDVIPPSPAGPGGDEYPIFPIDMYHYDPTYTPIAILFEPFQNVQPGGTTGAPIGNTYGVTVQTQFLAHYKQGSMLANMAFSPMSDSNKLNTHRDKEEATGSAMQKVMDVVSGVGQFAWEHRADLAMLAPLVM